MMYLYESGNVFDNTSDVLKQDVPTVIDTARRVLPPALQNQVIKDIGSAGFKVASGDIDLFIDQDAALKNYGVDDPAAAKKALQTHLTAQGIPAVVKGRNVHANIPYKTADGKPANAQVDFMIIPNAARVADWHQHGTRGMYDDPNFKANQLFILLNSIGKALGVKVDAFAGTVLRRDNNEVVADNRKDAAKLLLNPKAKPEDLNSVATVMQALANDPDREAKLAQARQDQAKGLLTLPEDSAPGTAAWFRKMGHIL